MKAQMRLSVLKHRFDNRARQLAYWRQHASAFVRHLTLYRRAATLATLSWLLWWG